jgi:hypothetical protein
MVGAGTDPAPRSARQAEFQSGVPKRDNHKRAISVCRASVKHPFNQQLFAYWTERRGERTAPERSDIDPGAIRRILGDSFVLSREAGPDCLFRVAGTRLCALFGHELRDQPFSTIWQEPSAPEIRDHCAVVAEEGLGVVAGAVARTDDGLQCRFEMLLLPLLLRGRPGARLIGLIAAMEQPFWLGIWPSQKLRLGPVQYLGATAAPAVRFTAPRLRERKRRNLTIIDGGRS